MAQGGHGPAAGSKGRWPGLSPPPEEQHLEARETRALASFPTSGAGVSHGPEEAPVARPAMGPLPRCGHRQGGGELFSEGRQRCGGMPAGSLAGPWAGLLTTVLGGG